MPGPILNPTPATSSWRSLAQLFNLEPSADGQLVSPNLTFPLNENRVGTGIGHRTFAYTAAGCGNVTRLCRAHLGWTPATRRRHGSKADYREIPTREVLSPVVVTYAINACSCLKSNPKRSVESSMRCLHSRSDRIFLVGLSLSAFMSCSSTLFEQP